MSWVAPFLRAGETQSPAPAPGPAPRRRRAPPHLVDVRVLEVQRAAVCGLLREGQGVRPIGVLTPAGQPRMFCGRKRAREGRYAGRRARRGRVSPPRLPGRPDGITSLLTVTPDHVMSLRAQPPAGLRWLEGTSPVLETWLWAGEQGGEWAQRAGQGVSGVPGGWALTLVCSLSREAPIPAPSLPAEARLGLGLWRPVPPPAAARLLRFPCLRPDPPPELTLTPPQPSHLVRPRQCP